MNQSSPRFSGQQAIVVAAGVVTILGFVFDRLAVLNNWLGEPWLGGITAGVCLLICGRGWRLLENRWSPRATSFPFTAETPVAPAESSSTDDSGPWSPEVARRLQAINADTRIGDAQLQFNLRIPPNVLDTTLGEMALLRRMAQVRHQTMYDPFTGTEPVPRTRCEDVLTAAGSDNPKHSMVRLLGANLLSETDGECRCTEAALWMLSDFTTYLTKDPFLVAAYRTVMPRINRTIMLDHRPLET